MLGTTPAVSVKRQAVAAPLLALLWADIESLGLKAMSTPWLQHFSVHDDQGCIGSVEVKFQNTGLAYQSADLAKRPLVVRFVTETGVEVLKHAAFPTIEGARAKSRQVFNPHRIAALREEWARRGMDQHSHSRGGANWAA